MAARKKPTRPLVKIMSDLMKTLNDNDYQLPEDTTLVQAIRSHLSEEDVMLFADVRDHQLLDSDDGSSWAAVDIQLTIVDALYGDEVKVSYIGQASDPGMNAYDRAFDEAVKGCLVKTLVYRDIVKPEPVIEEIEEDSVEEDSVEEDLVEEDAPTEATETPAEAKVDTTLDDAQEESITVKDLSNVAAMVVEQDVPQPVDAVDGDHVQVTDESEDTTPEPEVEESQDEVEEVNVSAPVDETITDSEPSEETEEDNQPEEDSDVVVEEVIEERTEDAEDEGTDTSDEEVVEEATSDDTEDVATTPEVAEVVLTEDVDSVESDETLDADSGDEAPEFLGFSQHPLWQEYWEVLSAEVSAHGFEKDTFVNHLIKARSVEHLFWLSPEQLQSEVDHLDQMSEVEPYLTNPERTPATESERFMFVLQSVTDGESAMLFRNLYLSKMGADLLTDVDNKKLGAMVKKIMGYEDASKRAEYIDKVLSTEN